MKKFISLALLLVSSIAYALPSPSGWVVDEGAKLSKQSKAYIYSTSDALAKGGGPEVAVAVVNSISPENIESYSIKLAEYWKVGKKGKDNGVLFVVAVKERKLRIEVGYGLEGKLNDAKAGQILDRYVVPSLKAGNWDKGIVDGYNAILQAIK